MSGREKKSGKTRSRRKSEAVDGSGGGSGGGGGGDDGGNGMADGVDRDSDVTSTSMPGTEDGADGEGGQQFELETKVVEALDRIDQKRSTTRMQGASDLLNLLQNNVLTDFLSSRQEQMFTMASRLLRTDPAAAATILPVVLLQIGDDAESQYESLSSQLAVIINDTAQGEHERGLAVRALGFVNFLSQDVNHKFVETCEEIICDRSNSSEFRGEALSAWALLLSLMPAAQVQGKLRMFSGVIRAIFESHNSQTVLLAAGEALALLHESAEAHLMDDAVDDELLAVLQGLATESNKHKAKEDLKHQHSFFRSVKSAVEKGDCKTERIRVGTETIELESWSLQKRMSAVRTVLGGGLQVHLLSNMSVRSMFGLGLPRLVQAESAADKKARMQELAANKKVRTQARSRNRSDKFVE